MGTQSSGSGEKSEHCAIFDTHWEVFQITFRLQSTSASEFIGSQAKWKNHHKNRHPKKCYKRVEAVFMEFSGATLSISRDLWRWGNIQNMLLSFKPWNSSYNVWLLWKEHGQGQLPTNSPQSVMKGSYTTGKTVLQELNGMDMDSWKKYFIFWGS